MITRSNTFHVPVYELHELFKVYSDHRDVYGYYATEWFAQLKREGYLARIISFSRVEDLEGPEYQWLHLDVELIKIPEKPKLKMRELPVKTFKFGSAEIHVSSDGMSAVDADNYHVGELNAEEMVALAKDIMRRVEE